MADIIHSDYAIIPCPKCRGTEDCKTCNNVRQVRVLIDHIPVYVPEWVVV